MSKKLLLALSVIGLTFVACEKKEDNKAHEEPAKETAAETHKSDHAAPTADTHATSTTEAHTTEAQATPAEDNTEKPATAAK